MKSFLNSNSVIYFFEFQSYYDSFYNKFINCVEINYLFKAHNFYSNVYPGYHRSVVLKLLADQSIVIGIHSSSEQPHIHVTVEKQIDRSECHGSSPLF